ncbi:hypothetical protein HK102_008722 [Quaeritorhiza haematococci]|nr:hypothetical protein HK102_008722 [Quaeritorhiza haematococci]
MRGFGHLAPYMYGTLAIDSRRRGFYVDSEADPYYRLMKQAVDAAEKTFKVKEGPKVTYDNVNPALCLAFVIPTLSRMVEDQESFWDVIADGRLMDINTIFNIKDAANRAQILGRVKETWSFGSPSRMAAQFTQTVTARTDIYILNGL